MQTVRAMQYCRDLRCAVIIGASHSKISHILKQSVSLCLKDSTFLTGKETSLNLLSRELLDEQCICWCLQFPETSYYEEKNTAENMQAIQVSADV